MRPLQVRRTRARTLSELVQGRLCECGEAEGMGVRPFERIETLRKSGPTVFINSYSTSAALSAQTQRGRDPGNCPRPACHNRLRPRFRIRFTPLSPHTHVVAVFKQYKCSHLERFLLVTVWPTSKIDIRPTASYAFFSMPYPIQPLTSSHHITTNPACLRASAHRSLDVSFQSSF